MAGHGPVDGSLRIHKIRFMPTRRTAHPPTRGIAGPCLPCGFDLSSAVECVDEGVRVMLSLKLRCAACGEPGRNRKGAA